MSMAAPTEQNVEASARAARTQVSATRLMSTFAVVGLCAFGGVMPWVHRTVVEKERWLDDKEFTELWGVSLILPGATSTNVVVQLGHRLGGLRGAIASFHGLLAPPFVIVILMAELYNRFGTRPAVHGAVRGVTAVGAGLVIATGIKLALAQPRKLALPLFGLAAFLGVTVLRWPLHAVLALLIPLSFASEWRSSK